MGHTALKATRATLTFDMIREMRADRGGNVEMGPVSELVNQVSQP